FDEPGRLAKQAGAQVLCVLNASPFHLGKVAEREEQMAQRARVLELPLLYSHLSGGQDEVVFDGASFAVNATGEVTARAPMFDEFKESLAIEFAGLKEDATEENIQARIRGTLLMALSNKLGSIVLTTGNKSEMATGYCTLYGDMAGGFAVIKDVAKTLVYR